MVFKARKWLLRGGLALAAMLSGLALAAPSKPVQGEVRRIDAPAGKITLKHGPIPELDLPAMTLVYVVRDAAVLARVRPGDTVQFTADRVNGEYTVLTLTK